MLYTLQLHFFPKCDLVGHYDTITGVPVMFCTMEKGEGEIFGETNKKRPKMVVEIFYWVLANGMRSPPQ